ncbi:10022_t:CDS:1 [Diversispora eburnea]|uniref:10022_t:CDS:1 n=1 Tax=Diversispora eburnea TaxID=1213867 RepID=A0A9N8ZMV3_9GLOM|nr:10022_t:CDS:1 [Diversispora eburnea]
MILQLLYCPLCVNLFKDPVTFSCGNTFCRQCLLPSSTNRRFQCPIQSCNRQHEINTVTDFSINKLTDIIRREQLPLISALPQFNLSQFDCLKDLLLQELDCKVCYQLFIDPITTPCGHTYCKSCLTRSLDLNGRCPLCRYQLQDYISFINQPINKTLHTFIISLYSTLLSEGRRQLVENDVNDINDMQYIPIFATSLVFPNMSCFLNIYEPRYKLMIRRCLESRTRQFGMVLKTENGFTEYGTMLEIRSTEVLEDDGRLMVETIGTYRFRVLETGMRDGYDVGKIERVDDISAEEEIAREREAIRNAGINNALEHTTSELITLASGLIEDIRNGYAAWLEQRINSTYGELPNDPSNFSYWVASILPINENEKYKLLEERSVRERLKLVVMWIEQIRGEWWFSRGCCIS